MLQAINILQAIKSPCYTCPTHKKPDLFDSCADFCKPLNNYLVFLGDKPREPDTYDFSKFPPQGHSQNNQDLCTPEMCEDLTERLIARKKELGITAERISIQSGVNVSLVRSLCRRGQKRTSMKNYWKLENWLNKGGSRQLSKQWRQCLKQFSL